MEGTNSDVRSYDRTSRVPKYRFADTLEVQEAQLRTNPMLRRFAESRKRLANDLHRPIYHYVNPEGRLNDPNGLCFWKDRWHLFYQAYPPEDPRQHWGHAVSDDLIHWRDLPLAIYPDPERCCFSGSTFVEDDRVIAMTQTPICAIRQEGGTVGVSRLTCCGASSISPTWHEGCAVRCQKWLDTALRRSYLWRDQGPGSCVCCVVCREDDARREETDQHRTP